MAPFEPWVVMAVITSALALLSLVFYKPDSLPDASVKKKRLAYSLAPSILFGTLLLISFTAKSDAESTITYTIWEILGLVVWVPIVEEIVFRRTLYSWLSQRFPQLWSIYLAGFLFAFAHASPPYFWPPLGPLLLGLLASWTYAITGRLLAPILLHSVCNGSAILFALYGPSWLEHLSWLYQKL